MKINTVSLVSILACFAFYNTLLSEQLITLFLSSYTSAASEAPRKMASKLHKPGKIAHMYAKDTLSQSLSGIFATYAGFLTVSDLNNEISFVRKHSEPLLYLLVTQKISPRIIAGNTIHHWEIEQGVPAQLFKLQEVYDNKTKALYWNVTDIPLPQDRRISLETLILFMDPKFVIVPTGITLVTLSPHLILPEIYLKKGFNLTQEALYVLNLSQYFGGIIPLFKKEKIRYSRQLTY